MLFNRFIYCTVFLYILCSGMPAHAQAKDNNKIKVLAFDAFPVFDPRPVFVLAEELYPGHGKELCDTWRTRQFEYQWQRALSGNYKNFEGVTADALEFAMKANKLEADKDKKERLVAAYMQLKVWPDVKEALGKLQKAGYKLVFLSNMTEQMLRQNMESNGIGGFFTAVYSTDINHTYKPATDAYALALKKLHLKKEEVGFVAFAGWDASGAKTFGYPTFWVNRQNAPAEELGVKPDWTGSSLGELAAFLDR